MLVMCARGCGVAINVTMEVIEEATKHGQPVDVSHEVCPRDMVTLPEYRVVITVSKKLPGDSDTEYIELARNGATVSAESFAHAYEALSKDLGKQWGTVGEMRHVIESEEPTRHAD